MKVNEIRNLTTEEINNKIKELEQQIVKVIS